MALAFQFAVDSLMSNWYALNLFFLFSLKVSYFYFNSYLEKPFIHSAGFVIIFTSSDTENKKAELLLNTEYNLPYF